MTDAVKILDDVPAVVPAGLPFRRWLHAWLFDQHIEGNYHKAIDRLIALLIISNLFALLFEHVPAVYEPWRAWFHGFDVVSVVIFTIEYLLRWYVAPEDSEFSSHPRPRWSYVRSPFALVDLLAILPFYLSMIVALDLRMLRALRLLRIFKLMRVLVPAVHEFRALNQGRTFRQKVHALVWPSDFGGQLHGYFDTFIVIWVIVSVLAVILESVESIEFVLQLEFIVLDTIAVLVFTLEYLMRIYSAVEQPGMRHPLIGRLRFAKSPGALIDLMAILPFFLEVLLHHLIDLRFLRVFRLMRLLKLTRYTGATKTLGRVIRREWPVLGASAFVMLLLVVLTASLGFLFEHEAQPDKFENIPQSIYWAVVTLASVGYGDISPVTPMGRAMTIILALLGIGIFAIPAALLSSAFTDQLRIERETLQNELYNMLADGTISEEEQEIIRGEAKRLHLSQEEVDRLIEKARRQREQTSNHALMSMPQLIAQPAAAVERYRELLSQMRQLAQLCDAGQMTRIIENPDKATGLERDVWSRLTSGTLPQPPG